MPMTCFEPRTSGVGSNRSTHWATTTAPKQYFEGLLKRHRAALPLLQWDSVEAHKLQEGLYFESLIMQEKSDKQK